MCCFNQNRRGARGKKRGRRFPTTKNSKTTTVDVDQNFPSSQPVNVKLEAYLFGERFNGHAFDGILLGYLKEPGAYVVRDPVNRELFLLPRRMIVEKVVEEAPFEKEGKNGFRFPLGSVVDFTIG